MDGAGVTGRDDGTAPGRTWSEVHVTVLDPDERGVVGHDLGWRPLRPWPEDLRYRDMERPDRDR